ncbi:hypothetical protein B0H11DRAFT_358724 [Mycena galericulata]|nr:hypothetical protein B0H11DRAFT_358724 [Mycena galericulata]
MDGERKPISQWLPNEIITDIIQAAPKAELVALCRTSMLFHSIGVSILYRAVDLDETRSDSFSSAVLSNPYLAEYVRFFKIERGEIDQLLHPTTSSANLLACLKILVRVEHLSVDFSLLQEGHRYEFLHCTFPHLVGWSLPMYEQESLVNMPLFSSNRSTYPPVDTLAFSFLSRHPALKSLALGSFFNIVSSPVSLSSLQEFNGPTDLVPWIFSRNLREVQLSWMNLRSERDVEPSILAIRPQIPNNIAFTCSNKYCAPYFPEIMDSILKNIPQTKALRMQVFHVQPSDDENFTRVKSCLRRPSHLQFLSFETSDNFSAAETLVLAESFGDTCPTLVGFRLNQRAFSRGSGMWEKDSARDFSSLAGFTLL